MRKMSSGAGKTVCVTGASGFIASWIVKFLLQRGYIVKACVRNPNDLSKTAHLLALDGAEERLHLLKANLLEEGSFDSAVEGCEGVFHTASPCFLEAEDPQAELLDPAIKGTLNVLHSCGKSASVKRVVLTSSMAAVSVTARPKGPDAVVDETWFSDPELCRKAEYWYMLSKTLAEETAWKFARERNMDLVSINPGIVIGPLLQTALNTSSSIVLDLINGAKSYPNASHGWVHVKDVANAHIQAFENPSANGRYCLVESVVHFCDVVKTLKKLFPTLELPQKCADDKAFTPTYEVSRDKIKSLGVEYTPFEVGLRETVESLKEKKLIQNV